MIPIKKKAKVSPLQADRFKAVSVTSPAGVTTDLRGLTQTERQQISGERPSVVPSERVARLKDIADKEELRISIKEKMQQGATIQEIRNELIDEELKKAAETKEPSIPSVDQLREDTKIPEENINEKLQAEEEAKRQEVIQAGETGGIKEKVNAFGAKIGAGSLEAERKALTKKFIFKPAAQIYDGIYSLFQGGKGIQQKEAEGSFTDAMQQINRDIDLVRSGLKSSAEAKKDFELAAASLNRLEASAKNLGALNLRYWITDGADVETQLSINLGLLEDKRKELLRAELESSFGL